MKMIKLSDETHGRLSVMGSKSETFDDVINRLINFYDSADIDEE